MRFYLMTVQHNKEADAENRIAPKAFNLEEEAIAEFHTQMGKDMKNSTLDWAISVIINEYGGIIKNERWTRYVEPEIVIEPDGSKENPIPFTFGQENTVEMGKWYVYEDDANYIVELCIKDGVTQSFFNRDWFIVDQQYIDNTIDVL